MKWLKVRRQAIGVKQEAIFRRLHGQGAIGERQHADPAADIYKAIAKWIRMSEQHVNRVSGHSIRVGAAQDLLAMNPNIGAIMQAGRWKFARMPPRYFERIAMSRGAIAKAADLQGRNNLTTPNSP